MQFRLVEMVLPLEHVTEAEKVLAAHKPVDVWYDRLSESQILLKILVSTEETEAVLDELEKYFGMLESFRVILLPILATVPRPEEPKAAEEKDQAGEEQKEKKKSERVSREELYAQVSAMAKLSRIFLAMVVLSTLVAAIGIVNNNVAVVIGAMVIAPLLGPNMALALATTLGDKELAADALKSIGVGLSLALGLAVALGLVFPVDLLIPEVASRVRVNPADIVLALAAGIAGALALTTNVPGSLIGVMVAVALLPPLVVLGLLLGSGRFYAAAGAMLLTLANVICLNLAGILTFAFQGIRPTTWYEQNQARKATKTALIIWVGLLLVLMGILFSARKLSLSALGVIF